MQIQHNSSSIPCIQITLTPTSMFCALTLLHTPTIKIYLDPSVPAQSVVTDRCNPTTRVDAETNGLVQIGSSTCSLWSFDGQDRYQPYGVFLARIGIVVQLNRFGMRVLDHWSTLSWIRTCSAEYRMLLTWMGVVRDVNVLRTEQKTPQIDIRVCALTKENIYVVHCHMIHHKLHQT